jgi:hypothetical protein
MSND